MNDHGTLLVQSAEADEFTERSVDLGWEDISYLRTAKGPFSGQFAMRPVGCATVTYEVYHGGLNVLCTVPPEWMVVCVPIGDANGIRMNGVEVGNGQVLCGSPRAASDVLFPFAFEGVILHLPWKRVVQTWADFHPEGPEQDIPFGVLKAGSEGNLQGLARQLKRCAFSRNSTGAVTETEMVERTCLALASAVPRPPSRQTDRRARLRLAKRARAILHEQFRGPLTFSALCRTLGANERTLRRAFNEVYGISPRTYLLHLRLHHARRLLVQSSAGGGVVTKAAFSSGFQHLGRFSQHYRELFGELPRQSLRRSWAPKAN